MRIPCQLALAHLKQHKGKALLICLILFGLTFLPLFVLSTADRLHHQLLKRAQSTPLILTPARGDVESVLHHLHFQWDETPPSFTPSESFVLFDQRPMEALPLALFYDLLSKEGGERAPLLGCPGEYLNFRNLKVKHGRAPLYPGEVILGRSLAQQWNVKSGDFLMTAPKHLIDISKAHQLELEVVGILESSNGPEDNIAITLPETVWIKMGLGHGHPKDDLKGVPQELHMSVHSEQEGYRKIGKNNHKDLHFHQPKNLLPLTGMILLPTNQEERLFALSWGDHHPSLNVLDPTKVTQRILASLHRLGDLLLGLITVVSLISLALMGMLLRMDIMMRKRDRCVLEELGIPTSTFYLNILIEWMVYLGIASVMSTALVALARGSDLPLLDILSLIKD